MMIKNRLKKLYNQIRGFFPSRLPVGASAFEAWAKSIADTYIMPTQNFDSILFSLSTMVMHLGPKDAYKSKYYFSLMLNASASKQVAGYVFQEVKLKQKRQEEEAKAAAAKAAQELTEATATPVLSVVNSGQES